MPWGRDTIFHRVLKLGIDVLSELQVFDVTTMEIIFHS